MIPIFPPEIWDSFDRVRAFSESIKPVWTPIVLKTVQEHIEIDGDRRDLGPFDDLAMLHACDRAILASRIQPDRAGAEETALRDKKQKVIKTMKQAQLAYKSGQDRAAGDN